MAGVGALAHDVVVSGQLLARLSATLTRIGAGAAVRVMQVRAAQHEVATDVAGLRAVEQRTDVLGRGVLPALG